MNDLISRDALIKHIQSIPDISGLCLEKVIAVNDVVEIIRGEKAVDAVPVVRCKDCIDWRHEVTESIHWVCARYSNCENKKFFHTPPDWYCARGERRK